MPPKKKQKDTSFNTVIFFHGHLSSTPIKMTKHLSNGDLVRYLHHRKELDYNKNASWDSLFSCPLIRGTNQASCHITGCQFKGGEDQCGVSFAKGTGGWLKTGLPLKSDQTVKINISHIFKEWQGINKKSTRLSKPNLTASQKELVQTFKSKMDSTFMITDDKAEEMIAKDKLRDAIQKEEDIAFLNSMKGDIIASVSSKDNVFQERVDNKSKRHADEERRMKDNIFIDNNHNTRLVEEDTEDTVVSDDEADEDFLKRKEKNNKKKYSHD